MPITFNSIDDPYGLREAGSALGQALREKTRESVQNNREIERESRGEKREERQYERNRERAVDAITPLENLDTKGMTQTQIIAAYSKALANVPGGSQILSEILPVVLKQGQNNSLFGGNGGQNSAMFGENRGQQASGGVSTGGNATNVLDNVLRSQGVQQGMQQGGIGAPQGNQGAFTKPIPGMQPTPPGEIQSPARAQFLGMPRDEMLSLASQSPDPGGYIDFWSKVNKKDREERQDAWTEYENQYEAQSKKIAREAEFRTFSQGATKDKNYSSDELNRLQRYSEKYSAEPSLTNRLHFAEQDLQKFNNAVSAFKTAQSAPSFTENLFRGKGPAMQSVKLAVEPLIEMGEIDLAKKEVSNLGFGPLDTEEIVNPLPREAIKEIKGIPNAIKTTTYGRPDSPGTANKSKQLQNKRMDQVEHLSYDISNAIANSPPNTSLKLLRDMLIKDKGYTETEFNYAFNKAKEKGLRLSDMQKTEQTELGRSHQRRPFIDIFFSEEYFSPKALNPFNDIEDQGKETSKYLRGYR